MLLRDTALLLTLYGTAMAVTELATVAVGDYLMPNGTVSVTSAVRPDIALNGANRTLCWSNKRVCMLSMLTLRGGTRSATGARSNVMRIKTSTQTAHFS